MNSPPPLFLQERPDTCALACLRMVLAAYGIAVDESTLVSQAKMEPGGTAIDEVERLARSFGLRAVIQDPTTDEIGALLASGQLAIVYLNRRVFDLRDI